MDAIETERLTLRNFRTGDEADLFAYWREPTASCFLSQKPTDINAAKAVVERFSRSDDAIAVALRDSGRLIGDLFAMPEDDTFSVGWNFNPAYAGRGLASEAARALFAHLFTARQARRLYAYVEDHNHASRRLCERLGMRQEGLFLEFISFHSDDNGDPIYENTMQYAILRKEWIAQ